VYTVNDLWEVLLLVQIGQFKDESLVQNIKLSSICRVEEITTYLGQSYLPDEMQEMIDIIRVAEIQVLGLKQCSSSIVQHKRGETSAPHKS
jgi:hypothetical protein